MLRFVIPILLNINVTNIPDLNSLKETVKKVEEETAKYKNYANKLVAVAENKQTAPISVDDKNSGVIDKWLNDYRQIKNEEKNSKAKEGLYIFVSFSLPNIVLENLDKAAQNCGAKLVIRGLKDNSFKETLNYIKGIRQEGITIDIDPESFRQFGITHVPAFVLSQGAKYDKIVGNISMIYVLNRYASKGDTAVLAKEYLRRLENNA